ncbi:MAG: hypothetical protein ABIO04_02645 [Ferruginibacter sp.]
MKNQNQLKCPICGRIIDLRDVRKVFSHEANECVPFRSGKENLLTGHKIRNKKKTSVNLVWITKI